MDMHLFITGGTGFLGTSLIGKVLAADPDTWVTLLIRGRDEAEVRGRVKGLATWIERHEGVTDAASRIRGVRGDVTLPRCGLSPAQWERITRTATQVIHGAATIRFDHPIAVARSVNVAGTRAALELARAGAKRGALERFVYVGTSSVSGRRTGRVFEHELEEGQAFFNTYEQSKAESERLVRDHFEEFPCTVFRPSIVVGDSRTGWTSLFNAIYLPLRVLYRGLLPALPARPQALLDIVPVDWAAEAMTRIMAMPRSMGSVCHLTAGPDRATKLGDFIRIAAAWFDQRAPLNEPRRVEFVSPAAWEPRLGKLPKRQRAILTQLGSLLPYIGIDRLFDSTNTDLFLARTGPELPAFADYAPALLDYCLQSNWGRKPSRGAGGVKGGNVG